MADGPTPPESAEKQLGEIVADVSSKASLLVREEIELAKAELSAKAKKAAIGVVVGVSAGIFAVFGLLLLLEGLAWLAWFELFPDNQFFWGFFLVAGVLLVLAALSALIAARLFKAGAPPVPEMAIAEARKTKDELSSS